MPITAPPAQPVSPITTPPYGTLEIPTAEDEGPPEGLTLDAAIAVTLDRSLDLRGKFYEIPMARADTLQAGLRSNPVFYQDGQLLQYPGTSTQFSRAAPGGPSQVDTNISYPLDISHKRQARKMVAARAERVLEAQYQDAIRSRIDDVYGAYVNLLATRQTVRYATASVKGLERMLALNQDLHQKGQIPLSDLNLVRIKLRIARLGLRDAEAAYRKATQGEARPGCAHEFHERRSRRHRAAGLDPRRGTASARSRRAAEDCPGKPPRHPLVPAGRQPRERRRPAGPGQRPQRRLRLVAAVHAPE
jgi:cobalt-zinc-cadmium efflux system outer membrane protein